MEGDNSLEIPQDIDKFTEELEQDQEDSSAMLDFFLKQGSLMQGEEEEKV